MYRQLKFICCLCGLILTVACSMPAEMSDLSSDRDIPVTAEPAIATPPPAITAKLESFLQTHHGISAANIAVEQAEAMQWADACLGLPQPDEFCAQMLTPGYRIVLSTPEGEFDFHTDQTGNSWRLARSPFQSAISGENLVSIKLGYR